MNYRWSFLGALCLALLAPLQASADDNPIVVGQAIDLSGPNGSIGRDYVAGITTYFDSINVKGGINGRKIRYIVRDDRGEPAEAARLATELIRQDRAAYLVGAIGADATRAIVAAPAFRESKQVLFAPLADSAGMPRDRVLFWRPSVEREFLFVLDYFQNLGIKQVGIALQETQQHTAAFQFVNKEIKRRGMTLAGVAKIGADPRATEAEAHKLGAAGARLVLTIADTIGTAQFLKAFRQRDAATFVAGTSLINLSTLSELAGAKATEFTVFSQVVPNPGSTASVLQSEHIEMMKKFRDEPASALTLEGFSVAKTLVKAIQMERGGLQAMVSNKVSIDLGGMTMQSGDTANNMSRYVDIALFKRGGGLMF